MLFLLILWNATTTKMLEERSWNIYWVLKLSDVTILPWALQVRVQLGVLVSITVTTHYCSYNPQLLGLDITLVWAVCPPAISNSPVLRHWPWLQTGRSSNILLSWSKKHMSISFPPKWWGNSFVLVNILALDSVLILKFGANLSYFLQFFMDSTAHGAALLLAFTTDTLLGTLAQPNSYTI